MIPVQFHPLIPECESVSFQIMRVDFIKEFGCSTFIGSSVVRILTTSCHQAPFINTNTNQVQFVKSGPHFFSDILFQKEDQFQISLVSHIF